MSTDQRYDYIIVGAGSSGATLAARLTEDPDTTVLLLEAGPDYRADEAPDAMRSGNPFGITDPEEFPDFQWPALTARRTPVQEQLLYDRGRGLGGSSAINWQVAHRAMLEDYDRWAEQGCEGWSGEELLPAMVRLENDLDYGDMHYHGRGGPITIRRLPFSAWDAVDLALLEAGLDLGYPWSPDLNAPDSTGISPVPMNRYEGNRISTNVGYLEPARERDNLTIRGDAHADRVLFNGLSAVGVRAHSADGWINFLGREIILSAGSTFTPGILVRSGIGPAHELQTLGAPVLQDLPVGENLLDHSAVAINLVLKPEAQLDSHERRIITCCIRYSSGMADAGDNDMIMFGRSLNGFDSDDGVSLGAISAITWQNFSRGRLRVVDPDPFAMPEIEENLLSDERDLVRLRDGVRRLFEIGRHPAVQSISDEIYLSRERRNRPRAGDRTMDDITDERALDEWLFEAVTDTWHLVGTCRMGAADDPRSVVDRDCQVIGVTNLRVIDGSIMPEVPRANTNLTCITIAEHMASRMKRN